MPVVDLGQNWRRHYKTGSQATEAFLVSHGSHNPDDGFTTLPSPSDIHFYSFHSHTLYTVEIEQVLDYQSRIRLDNEIVSCKKKIATSIMGASGKCWNYYLSAWPQNHYNRFVQCWSDGSNNNKDLLILKANSGGLFESVFGGNSCKLNDLFKVLNTNNLAYTTIHFLCCRSVKGQDDRPTPPSTKPLYKCSNPYWPGL